MKPELPELGDWTNHCHDSLYEPRTVQRLIDEAYEAGKADARGWLPIESAPKDGRKIILFYRNANNLPRTVMASWVTDEEAAETDTDGVGLEAGWYESIDNWDDYCQVAIHAGEPTHWMPLPPPPEQPK